MKPLFRLCELKEANERGEITFAGSEERRGKLVDLLGDDYGEVIRRICEKLEPSDFYGQWGAEQGGNRADVYGIMADSFGKRSEEEYAWYIKIGVRQVSDLRGPKWFLSFHPTSEMVLANGTELRTTVEGYGEYNDD